MAMCHTGTFQQLLGSALRVLSNSSGFPEGGIPAYTSNTWTMLNPLHSTYTWLLGQSAIPATKLLLHSLTVQPKPAGFFSMALNTRSCNFHYITVNYRHLQKIGKTILTSQHLAISSFNESQYSDT